LIGSRSEDCGVQRVYFPFVLAGAKSRISEMLISFMRKRKPSRSAVPSKMILVSLGHDDLSQ